MLLILSSKSSEHIEPSVETGLSTWQTYFQTVPITCPAPLVRFKNSLASTNKNIPILSSKFRTKSGLRTLTPMTISENWVYYKTIYGLSNGVPHIRRRFRGENKNFLLYSFSPIIEFIKKTLFEKTIRGNVNFALFFNFF
jgi:hypothetical protein